MILKPKNVKNSLKKEFDCKPIYNEKYLKAKIKSYSGKINTNFHSNKLPKGGLWYICLSTNFFDTVLRTGKSYYLQVILEEFNYVIKEKNSLVYYWWCRWCKKNSDGKNFWLWRKIWWENCRKNLDEKNSDEENSDKENSSEEN